KIVLVDFPALMRCVQPVSKTAVLLFLGNVKEQFDQMRSAINLLRFKFIDFIIAALPRGIAAKPLNPLHQNAAIPATVEHSDFTAARQAFPKPPKEMPVEFFLSGRTNRENFKIARVPFGSHPPDATALARCVPAFENQDCPVPVNDMLGMNMGQPLLHVIQRI